MGLTCSKIYQYWADFVKCRPKSNHVSQKFLEKHLRAPHIAVPTSNSLHSPPLPLPRRPPLPSSPTKPYYALPSPPRRRRPRPQSRCTRTGAPGGSAPSGTASGRAAARAPGLKTQKGASSSSPGSNRRSFRHYRARWRYMFAASVWIGNWTEMVAEMLSRV